MDAEKFGAFIQERRKELGITQSELAQRIHVTDKAISRWERAVGFPDIKLLEPLAQALEVSLTELLQAKIIESAVEAEALESQNAQILEDQKKLSWQRRLVLAVGYAAIAAASVVLVRVSHNAALSFGLQRAVYFIALIGGSFCARMLQFIVERLHLKSKPWGLWHYPYTWITYAVSMLGGWLSVNCWMIKTPDPVWNAVLFLCGVALVIGAWIYFALQDEKRKNEEE